MYFTTIVFFFFYFKVKVKVLGAQLCPALGNPMDYSLPGSSVHGIIQARKLQGGLPFPSPGALPDPGIEPRSLTSMTDSLPPEPPGKPNFSF